MSIPVSCSCGKKYLAPDAAAGKKIRCKACQRPITVPAPEEEDRGEYGLLEDAADAAAVAPAIDETPIDKTPADREPGERPIVPMPWDQDPAIRGGGFIVASNPGKLKFQPLTYLLCLPPSVPSWIVLCTAIVLFVWIKKPEMLPASFIGIPIAIAIYSFVDGRVMKAKFLEGTRNPAIVVSDFPYRVAVYADLSTTRGKVMPSIRITEQPLRFIRGGRPKVGTRMAAVANYFGPADRPHWSHFDPTIINCGITDQARIASVVRSLPKSEWAALDRGLEVLNTKKPGMYYLWGDEPTRMATSPVLWAAVILIFVVGVILLFVNFGKEWFGSDERRSTPIVAPVGPVMPPVRSPPRTGLPFPQRPSTPSTTHPTAPIAWPAVEGQRILFQQNPNGFWRPGIVVKVEDDRAFIQSTGEPTPPVWIPRGQIRSTKIGP